MFLKNCLLFIGLIGLGGGICSAAAQCEVTINSTDQISWDQQAIEISKSCEEFTVHLVHEGSLHKDVMGHNWVLTKECDKQAIVRAAAMQKDNDYIKDDPRIVVHTALIGAGEKSTVSFEVGKLELGQNYVFFCSYPEHSELMQGNLIIID